MAAAATAEAERGAGPMSCSIAASEDDGCLECLAAAGDDCLVCWAGLMLSLETCVALLCTNRKPRAASEVAPVLRERILNRKKSGAPVLDIHTLMVSPDPGRNLAKSYKTIALLGKGGFGSVFRVQYLPLGEERAAKIIDKPAAGTDFARCVTEVETLVRLDHPCIEKFFEYFEDAHKICLITELCSGGNVGDLDPAEDGDAEIRRLFRDVVSAVAYCHSEGITHRDLKFENCLLTEREGRHRRMAKIIDFGLSSVRPSGEVADRWMHEAVGTAYFIAPEVLGSERGWQVKYGPKCDMWSIGVMLYIVYTDQHPFARSCIDVSTMVKRVRRDVVRTFPLTESGVDQATQDLVVSLLAKDPAKRLSAEEALAHPFFAHGPSASASGTPSAATPTPRASPKSLSTMMGRVCSFAHFSRLERAILTIVAHDAERKEVDDLYVAFRSLDTNKVGWLSREGVKAALASRGVAGPRGEELDLALDALDPDGDDKIQYTDWLAATIRPSLLTSERAMKEMWDFFDIHGVNTVSVEDIAEVLGEDVVSLSLPKGVKIDGDGCISWEAFQKLVRQVAVHLQHEVDATLERQTKDRRAMRRWLGNYNHAAPSSRRVAASVRCIEDPTRGEQATGKTKSKSKSLTQFR